MGCYDDYWMPQWLWNNMIIMVDDDDMEER